MAKLDFSVRGFVYESGIDCLRDSFTAAATGIQDRVREESEAWESCLQSGEYDDQLEFAEDGSVLFDPVDVYQYKMEALDEAHSELRKAFAIAIYHYWERKIRVFCKLPDGKHTELESGAKKFGIEIPPEFARVHRLANALKHNNRGSVNALHREWPDVSGVLFEARGHRDWYAGIELTDEHIYYLLDLAKQAGPSVRKRETGPAASTATPAA
ncbi:hypothetical protein [Neorhizobium galegae]|uniref:hypothetical protein n=1 Tax=Neorhizobium galegae TaxID=399 RepID=UPI0021061788|nr:hypothetical protein [Neorhizobium galegae]MCQ1852466.1 hypothetical protein [Neorhizobium galegae]